MDVEWRRIDFWQWWRNFISGLWRSWKMCVPVKTRWTMPSTKMHIGEGNGNSLQYACLENPRDRGAWWAAVYDWSDLACMHAKMHIITHKYTSVSLVAQLVKNPPAMWDTRVWSLGWYPGEGKGYPLQYSVWEDSIDCIVHGVTKSWTRLSDFHSHFTFTLLQSCFRKISHMKIQT